MTGDPDDRERAARAARRGDAHWAALARYLGGDATPAQRAHVEHWAAAADANRRELADLRALWQLTGVLPTPARVDALWRDLTERMHRPEASAAPPAVASGVPPPSAPECPAPAAPAVRPPPPVTASRQDPNE